MPTRSATRTRNPRRATLSDTPAPVRTLTPTRPEAPAPVRRLFVLENDPQAVGPLIAALCADLVAVGTCDPHTASRVGIALEEALLNAIYHGNLEISSELKANGDEPFRALARERGAAEPYAARRVRGVALVTSRKAAFIITDEGPGFDVANLPDPTDPENLERPSGRGLLLMRAYMDEVRYNTTGNQVTMIKLRSES
jgi:anti-sigma regulatory factor (Ser/Thr protein kinase)